VRTDELIENLSGDLAPVAQATLARRLAAGLLMGMAVSFLVMWLWLGIRPDLVQAMATMGYWMKFAYTLAFTVLAFLLVERLMRPGVSARRQIWLSLVPFALLAILAAMRLGLTPDSARMALVLGHSHLVCPWNIVALSVPVFIAVFWSVRAFAPTRLVLAGAAAGLLAGAAGAFVYAFHCDESAMPFVAIWYTLGIVGVGALGGAVGGWVLRW
jgi:hypothetical protein